MIRNISIIGAGNVGTHLTKTFYKKGLKIECVYSRKKKNARVLATSVRAEFTDDLKKIAPNSDLYLLCVPDGAIEEVSQILKESIHPKAIICHTSGSTDGSSLSKYFKHSGVFYPLQTFSKHRKIKLSEVPIFISAYSKKTEKALLKLSKMISSKSEVISDQQRLVLHIAAVFANNFSNYLFQISDEILRKEELHFDTIRPLIKETAAKIQSHSPSEMQTGPALRSDLKTLKKHMDYLEKNHPDSLNMYKLLSNAIQNTK